MKKVSLFLIIAIFLLLPKFSFAQDVPCKATNTICGGQTAYDTCTPICLGTDAAYSCYQSSNPNCIGQIYCNSENSRCQQTTTTQPATPQQPAPAAPNPQTATCQTDCKKCQSKITCGTTTYDICIDDKSQISSNLGFCKNGATKFRCYASQNQNCASIDPNNPVNEYSYSCSGCNIGSPAPNPPSSNPPSTQPSVNPSTNPSEKPAPKKPVRIIISQFDQPVQTLDPSAINMNEAKIHLNFDANGIANVRFEVDYDYQNNDVESYYLQFKSKEKAAENVSPAENQTKNVKVLSLKYFPLDSSGNKLDPNITFMSTPLSSIRAFVDSLNITIADDLTKASKFHGYKTNSQSALNYTVVDSKEFLKPIPVSTHRAYSDPGKGFRPDYRKVLNDISICDYVDNKGVGQVWIWSYHTKDVEINESNMSMGTDSQAYWNHGNYGDISNSEQVNDLPTCQKTYVLYNYNYSRSIGEALEDHGHQIEAVLRYVDYNLFWNNFVKPNGDKNGINHCGWVHSPPNVSDNQQYDWVNEASVQSDCEDWKPDGGGQVKDVNCHTWYQYSAGNICPKDAGGFSTDTGAQFKIWWMQNIPGINNGLTYKGNNLRNWWSFIGDFDTAIAAGKSLVVRPVRTALQSVSNSTGQSDSNYIPPASLPHPLYPPVTIPSNPQLTPTSTSEPLKLIDFNNDGVE